jgi:lysophospholipase L1-like esterase
MKKIMCICVGLCCMVQVTLAKSLPGKHNSSIIYLVTNIPPVANAGSDQVITNPLDSILLDGNASYDPDGTIVSYNWDYVGNPYNVYQFADTNQAIVRVRDLKVGTYIFQLTVTDNLGAVSTDTVSVIVNIMPTPPPTDTDVINCGHAFTIVVLGSSTAYGDGAFPIDSSWVNKYTSYAIAKNPQNTIINLAVPGYTTYQVLCPDNYTPPDGRPAPDTAHNITKALLYHPDAIIINLPTNDVADGYTIAEQQANYARAVALINAANIPFWVTTTQPRNTVSDDQRDSLKVMRDWTYTTFGIKALDFWTTVADSSGMIVNVYNADGTHVDNYGHYIFFTRVVAAKILDSLCNRYDEQIPLAIGFLDLAAENTGNNIKLTWNTQNDVNVLKYVLQKSGNGSDFYSIDTVYSNQSTLSSVYYYNDKTPFAGTNYYRVKIYNVDSTTAFSNVVQIDFGNSTNSIFVYPNPVVSELSLNLNAVKKGQYQVSIISNEGKKIFSMPIVYNGIDNLMHINLPAATSSGIYRIFLNGDAGFYKQSFIVK